MKRHVGELEVSWLDGGILIEHRGHALLLDAPAGVHRALSVATLGRLRGVALSSGRIHSVGGLVALLCVLEPHRGGGTPLPLRFALGEERAAALVEAWMRGWPRCFPVELDALAPGSRFSVGALDVETHAIRHGEPRYHGGAQIAPAVGMAFRVRGPGAVVAWVPGAAPTGAVKRVLRDVDLAVVEVGTTPWPRSDVRWRLGADDAVRAAAGVDELWLVGDDGRFGLDDSDH